MSPRVAVSMAVYNEERYLPLALGALCRQTFRDLHVTVWDDGSTDGSADLAQRHAADLPLQVIRGQHLGRHFAKQASWSHAAPAPYLLVLDADIVLPPDALERMVAALEADASVAAISARYRAAAGRPFGAAQAFIEDVFFEANGGTAGEGRWIAGGCVLFRRSALDGVEVRADLGEDQDLSQKLRGRWRLLQPADLVAIHLGVPSSAWGVVRRFDREGVRVRALHRAYPAARQATSLVRLVPLALVVAALAATLVQPMLGAAVLSSLAAYAAVFTVASRRVEARLADRLAGALVFTAGNVAFGFGYLREWLRGGGAVLREPRRSA